MSTDKAANIEPDVRPLCDAFNSIDQVRTVWSCHGHTHRGALPFVIFEATHNIAQLVAEAIQKARRDDLLRYNWSLSGRFFEGRMRFWLTPDDRRLPGRLPWPFKAWSRRTLRRELSQIAFAISNIRS